MPSSPSSSASTLDKYSGVAIVLHWVVAALILALLAVGYYFNVLPDGHDSRGPVISWHKSLGLTATALIVLRVVWRLTHRPPPLPTLLPRWQRTAAHANALFLYGLMLLQPVLGYLSTSYSGYSTRWFGLALPKWAEKSPELNEWFSAAHHIGAKLLVLALVLHIGGAAVHALIRRDGVLSRMLP